MQRLHFKERKKALFGTRGRQSKAWLKRSTCSSQLLPAPAFSSPSDFSPFQASPSSPLFSFHQSFGAFFCTPPTLNSLLSLFNKDPQGGFGPAALHCKNILYIIFLQEQHRELSSFGSCNNFSPALELNLPLVYHLDWVGLTTTLYLWDVPPKMLIKGNTCNISTNISPWRNVDCDADPSRPPFKRTSQSAAGMLPHFKGLLCQAKRPPFQTKT